MCCIAYNHHLDGRKVFKRRVRFADVKTVSALHEIVPPFISGLVPDDEVQYLDES